MDASAYAKGTGKVKLRAVIEPKAHLPGTLVIRELPAPADTASSLPPGLPLIAATAIARAAHWSTAVPFFAIALSFGISTAVGIFFGYYPAREASRVPPLASLRYE